MNIIELDIPKELTTVVTNTTIVKTVEYIFTDYGDSVVANITINNNTSNIITKVLWEGQDYINIGQYTDNDIKNKVFELLTIN